MRLSRASVGLLTVAVSSGAAVCQQATKPDVTPAPPKNYTGCVAKLPKLDKYVLAAGKSCILLRGKFDSAKVADHQVTLKGLLILPEDPDPLTLDVRETVAVKDACTQTCTLEPPGTRGVHGKGKPKETPGSEGGTAGVIPKPTPPPQ